MASEITHVLFRKQDQWTRDDVADWIDEHKFHPYDLETKHYNDGTTLLNGNYYVVRVVPKSKKFDRYAYGDEVKRGLWFKFGYK